MGIYSVKNINESNNANGELAPYLEELDGVEPYEFCESEDCLENALQICYESDVEIHNIYKSIGIAELAVYESTGQEMIYEAKSAGSVIERLKGYLTKLWGKISGLFTKILNKIKARVVSDSKFVKTFGKDIVAAANKVGSVKVEGYKYNLKAISSTEAFEKAKRSAPIAAALKVLQQDATKSNPELDKAGDSIDAVRNAILGSEDKKEFSAGIMKMLRGGAEKAETITYTSADIKYLLKTLVSGKDVQKSIQDDYNFVKKRVANLQKSLDRKKKEVAKADKKDADAKTNASVVTSNCTKATKLLGKTLSLCSTVNGAKLKALKAERHQARKVCQQLLKAAGKKDKDDKKGKKDEEAKNESFSSLLDGVDLI